MQILRACLVVLSLIFSSAQPGIAKAVAPKKGLAPLEAAKNFKKNLNPAKTAKPNALRDKWALIVALDKFHDKAIPPVKFAQNNALVMASLLSNAEIGKFGPKRVLTITNNKAIKTNVDKCLAEPWLLKNALPNDLVVLYFCTRYMPCQDNEDIRLCCYEADSTSPSTGTVKLKETLKELRRRIQSPYILTLLDLLPVDQNAPKSLPPDFFKKMATETRTAIWSANEPGSQSFPSSVSNTSFFVANLVEGFKTGAGEMDLATIAEYVKESIKGDVETRLNKSQIASLDVDPETNEILAIAPGMAVKSSSPERIKVGHPIESMPEVQARQEARERKKAQAAEAASQKAALAEEEAEEQNSASDGDFTDVDFGPYMKKMKRDIQTKWKPPKGFKQQSVVAVFSIARDGKIMNPEIVDGSGDLQIDKSAMDALNAASPLDPLPAGSPPYVQIRYQFDWKVSKN